MIRRKGPEMKLQYARILELKDILGFTGLTLSFWR